MNRNIKDITDFIFMNDEPRKCDVILIPGTSKSAISEKATNSMENAMFSAQVLKESGIEVKTAILCCQAFHARRAFLSYSCHFPEVDLLVVPSDTQNITRENWYESEKGYRKVMNEVAKCGKYFIDTFNNIRFCGRR